MLMDKIKPIVIVFLLLCAGCSDNNQARSSLEQARNLYENAQYGSAKQALDALKTQHPKAYDVQKEAIRLMREIEWKEQERNLAFCDSLLLVRQAEADSMKQSFVSVESASDIIKTSVNEANEIVLTSLYKGSSPIRYNQLRVSVPSGEYAETQVIPFDGGANYSFQDVFGTTYQTVTFQKGRDNGVVSFIYTYARAKITMEYTGGKKTSPRILSAKEKEALVRTVDYAAVLQEIDRLTKEKDKAGKRIHYLQSKL
jgi:hypothetical protein